MTQNSQNGVSCPQAELVAFESSAIFGPSEGVTRRSSRREWKL